MRNIPFSPPDITQTEIDAVVEVLKSGWITTGPKTKAFEKGIANWCNTDIAVCLNSQTACAEMTLRILGVGPGDEVIVLIIFIVGNCYLSLFAGYFSKGIVS